MTKHTDSTDRPHEKKRLTINRETLKDLEPREKDVDAIHGGLSFIKARSTKKYSLGAASMSSVG